MTEPRDARTRPLQYRPGDSRLHRLGAGWKLLGATAIGALALAQNAVPALLGLTLLVLAAYRWAGLSWLELWKDLRWLLVQGAIVVSLTLLLRGTGSLQAGLRTALQLLLAFLPFGLVLRTTSTESLLEPLRAHLPQRLGFALGAAPRLVSVCARELGELVEMQRLRGARLGVRDLPHPGAWRDWLACVAFPMTVRAVEVAEAAAEAAEIRGVGQLDDHRSTQPRESDR